MSSLKLCTCHRVFAQPRFRLGGIPGFRQASADSPEFRHSCAMVVQNCPRRSETSVGSFSLDVPRSTATTDGGCFGGCDSAALGPIRPIVRARLQGRKNRAHPSTPRGAAARQPPSPSHCAPPRAEAGQKRASRACYRKIIGPTSLCLLKICRKNLR